MHPSWATYFAGLDRGLASEDAFRPPPGLIAQFEGEAPLPIGQGSSSAVEDHMKVSGCFTGDLNL